MDDSTMLERKVACIWTDDIDCVKNINDEMIELDNDYCQNNVSDTNPFLYMLENFDAHGDSLATNLFIIDDARQIHPSGNPFLDINDTVELLNTGEGSPDLLSTNPFSLDCFNSQIIDISIFFPNGFDDLFTDIPYAHTDSDVPQRMD
ncbi:hypothetical protein AVEN_114443-1 [Araneus ventricosus]|uniref:Uncharacterized protein n=1 Tax=Araneus ventricosus TaxID=182803 RepID=A0A4Y2IH91_ARAVE|nr:hypothetical protein AVEN_114443-1 [Araneus ventricosus]